MFKYKESVNLFRRRDANGIQSRNLKITTACDIQERWTYPIRYGAQKFAAKPSETSTRLLFPRVLVGEEYRSERRRVCVLHRVLNRSKREGEHGECLDAYRKQVQKTNPRPEAC